MTLKTDTRAKITAYLPDLVGKGYGKFWRYKGRYRVVKGSRSSKKSSNAALWYIANMIKYPGSNTLVVRKTFRSLKDSCYAQLKWAIHQLGVDAFFYCKESPLEITYIPTGQKMYFRGLDDPLKVTSITVDKGALCWLWVEEAYEIMAEADFDTLSESIRGAVPQGLFKQITLTFNPWNEQHWLKKRFFDVANDPDVLAMTTNYRCNEWLDDADRRVFERMKIENPKRYKVAGLGGWGIVDGLVYENWETKVFDTNEVSKRPNVQSAFGLDYGYTNDPSALFCGLVDTVAREIYVFDEMYKKALTNFDIADELKQMGYAKELIIAESAEQKSNAELKRLGLPRVKSALKGPDSVNYGVQNVQGYKIFVHPRCVNFITEISNYQWAKDKFGKPTGKPEDFMNHLMDAMRYALERFSRNKSGIKPVKVNY